MRIKATYCFLLLLISHFLFSQQQKILFFQSKGQSIFQKTDSLGKKLSPDSVSHKSRNKLAHLQAKKQRTQKKVDKFTNQNRLAKLQSQADQKLDSLSAQNKANQSLSKIYHITDSLVPTRQLAPYPLKMDLAKGRITAKVDSLKNFKLPEIRLTKSIDSQKQKIDSLKNKGILRQALKAEKKLAGLQEKANVTMQASQQKIGSLQKGVNEELDQFNPDGTVRVNSNLPNLSNVGNGINVPPLNTQLPSVNGLPNMNGKTGNIGLPSLNGKVNASLQNTPTVNTGAGTGNIGLPSTDLKNIGLGDAGNSLNDVTNSTKEIGQYTEGMNNITKDGLNDEKLKKEMEANAAKLVGGNGLETQLTDIEKQKAMVEKWNNDPEYKKELAVNQAKEQVVNHFAGRQKELMAAVDQLSQAKTKIKDTEQVVELFKKPTNPMKGKPFIERLRPGITLQVQSRQNILIDFNPYIGYRFGGRITAGLGWNERVSFNSKKTSLNFDDRVYGPRGYAQVKVKGGSFLFLSADCLNIDLLTFNNDLTRQWIWSYLGGYKQEFKISNKLLCNVQILYTIHTSFYQSPYIDKLNIRMGFEFPQKKKVKRPS
jgi:hypothetical protein